MWEWGKSRSAYREQGTRPLPHRGASGGLDDAHWGFVAARSRHRERAWPCASSRSSRFPLEQRVDFPAQNLILEVIVDVMTKVDRPLQRLLIVLASGVHSALLVGDQRSHQTCESRKPGRVELDGLVGGRIGLFQAA
jgi:hypothetical protein